MKLNVCGNPTNYLQCGGCSKMASYSNGKHVEKHMDGRIQGYCFSGGGMICRSNREINSVWFRKAVFAPMELFEKFQVKYTVQHERDEEANHVWKQWMLLIKSAVSDWCFRYTKRRIICNKNGRDVLLKWLMDFIKQKNFLRF